MRSIEMSRSVCWKSADSGARVRPSERKGRMARLSITPQRVGMPERSAGRRSPNPNSFPVQSVIRSTRTIAAPQAQHERLVADRPNAAASPPLRDNPPMAPEDRESLRPLAERMRPLALDEMVGQRRLLAPGTALRKSIESGRVHSMVLWGPPGCGKTTLALLLARYADAEFRAVSAVLSGLPEVRQVLAEAAQR